LLHVWLIDRENLVRVVAQKRNRESILCHNAIGRLPHDRDYGFVINVKEPNVADVLGLAIKIEENSTSKDIVIGDSDFRIFILNDQDIAQIFAVWSSSRWFTSYADARSSQAALIIGRTEVGVVAVASIRCVEDTWTGLAFQSTLGRQSQTVISKLVGHICAWWK
jgi:hypothetical protein